MGGKLWPRECAVVYEYFNLRDIRERHTHLLIINIINTVLFTGYSTAQQYTAGSGWAVLFDIFESE